MDIKLTVVFKNGTSDTRAFKKLQLTRHAAQRFVGLRPEIVGNEARCHGFTVTVEGVNILDLFPRLDTRPLGERCSDLITRKVISRRA